MLKLTHPLEDSIEPKDQLKEEKSLVLTSVAPKNEAEIEKKYYAPLEEMRLRRLSRHNRQLIGSVSH